MEIKVGVILTVLDHIKISHVMFLKQNLQFVNVKLAISLLQAYVPHFVEIMLLLEMKYVMMEIKVDVSKIAKDQNHQIFRLVMQAKAI